MVDYLQVLTTVGSEDDAVHLGRTVIGAGLGACVQVVGPIRSLYRWRGNVEDDREWQLLIKTTTERLDALEEHIKRHHGYDTPEIIATPIVGGSAEYLRWVGEETSQGAASS